MVLLEPNSQSSQFSLDSLNCLIHRAWNAILQLETKDAYKLLYHSRENPTQEQTFLIQFILAIADCLDGRYTHAEQTLTMAPAFFWGAKDPLHACTAQLYLAYLYLQTERTDQAQIQIQKALTWLYQTDIACLPQWWHPKMMAYVLAHAIAYAIRSHIAEPVFIKCIGQEGKEALYAYLYTEDVEIQRNCYRVYRLVSDDLTDFVPNTPNSCVRQTIHCLLNQGTLRPEGFVCLQRILTTATQRNKPNAALIATFGLYIKRYDRVEIAETLDLSQSTIRNYITTLYEIFDLDQRDYAGRRARFRHLITIAQERGFIN